jgi:hypothetical protein
MLFLIIYLHRVQHDITTAMPSAPGLSISSVLLQLTITDKGNPPEYYKKPLSQSIQRK